ncbi:c-type cytochrome [Pedobacter sp. SYSU D00535]|uniref:c-type cytochrome n=1 Tax=Pedobacter sp. SYSU D00535 TaxID=2810308 RepID=UPI001A973FF0|nr:c-type cytochrome [Pedobacter sp. SYSU D00535]
MLRKRTAIVLSLLATVITITSATMPEKAEEKPEYKNLKVLPKNISHEELDKVMKHYNNALGVRCNFCHAPNKNGEKGLDFASDEKEEKTIARNMMKMTNKLNQKYFGTEKKVHNQAVMEVSCNTCHRGKAHPEG